MWVFCRLCVILSVCLFLAVETVQSNPQLLMETGGAASHRFQESSINETSIPVPVLNWQTSQPHTESVYPSLSLPSHSCLFVSDAEILLYYNFGFHLRGFGHDLYLLWKYFTHQEHLPVKEIRRGFKQLPVYCSFVVQMIVYLLCLCAVFLYNRRLLPTFNRCSFFNQIKWFTVNNLLTTCLIVWLLVFLDLRNYFVEYSVIITNRNDSKTTKIIP